MAAAVVVTAIPGTAAAAPAGRTWWSSVHPAARPAGGLHAVAARSATEAWAVGWQTTGAEDAALVHHWTGTQWKSVPPPPSDAVSVRLTGVDVLPSGDAIAVGSTTAGGRTEPLIHGYPADGRAAGEIPGPVPAEGGSWRGVDLVSATDGWAVGFRGSAVDGKPAGTLIARWDGSSWQRVPSPDPGTLSNRLSAVTAVAADDVWAVGQTRDADDAKVERSLVLHWDGVSWSRVASPDPGAVRTTLLAVSAAGPGQVWAVGYTQDVLTDEPDPDELHRAVALSYAGGVWKVLRSAQPAVTEYTGVAAVAPSDIVLAAYRLAGNTETTTIEEWHGGAMTPDQIDPGIGNGEHLGSALTGLAAEPGGGRLWAVGWRADLTGAHQPHSLRSTR
ncbi:hypothetical protein L083_5562 [Actinoplanes sp. N902-109]|nr:hypothetical protein L083_5562 [Actinoplanes sp. N902-109]